MTIKEAMELLRVVLPARERTIGITVEVMDYDHYEVGDPGRLRTEFRVWDGKNGHYGPTLEVAAQKALLANTPDRGVIEAAEVFAAEVEGWIGGSGVETA